MIIIIPFSASLGYVRMEYVPVIATITSSEWGDIHTLTQRYITSTYSGQGGQRGGGPESNSLSKDDGWQAALLRQQHKHNKSQDDDTKLQQTEEKQNRRWRKGGIHLPFQGHQNSNALCFGSQGLIQ